jgi:dTDP-glucose pyrophosphorylase
MKLVVPMAGLGERFKAAGYKRLKPFIDVNGQPMIKRVLDTLPETDQTILITRCDPKELESDDFLSIKQHRPNTTILNLEALTDGSVRTVLASESLINDEELIIANSDQLIEYDATEFQKTRAQGADGIVFTFTADHPKWSYARVVDGLITEVAEKVVISNEATCGVYYFKNGRDYVNAAYEMISKNIRTNGEFYNAPVYNILIGRGQRIVPFTVDKMIGLGTPEDLEAYLR